jgi:hypothetical protein
VCDEEISLTCEHRAAREWRRMVDRWVSLAPRKKVWAMEIQSGAVRYPYSSRPWLVQHVIRKKLIENPALTATMLLRALQRPQRTRANDHHSQPPN